MQVAGCIASMLSLISNATAESKVVVGAHLVGTTKGIAAGTSHVESGYGNPPPAMEHAGWEVVVQVHTLQSRVSEAPWK